MFSLRGHFREGTASFQSLNVFFQTEIGFIYHLFIQRKSLFYLGGFHFQKILVPNYCELLPNKVLEKFASNKLKDLTSTKLSFEKATFTQLFQ